uniref:Guanine nucleotide-binding protein G(Q) subunit alpha n=1 Tax=Elaeophora elaphi TaxID=1147741 RepID=A0A0R3RZQ0_9BILA
MGLCQSEFEKKLHERSKGIDREIKENAIENSQAIKLLLLGAGDSGKSTLLKQMRILHSSGFTRDELIKQRLVIFENTIHAMDAILRTMKLDGVKFNDPSRKDDAAVITEAISAESVSITYVIATAIKNLWEDPAIQTIYEKRHDFYLHESAKQFRLFFSLSLQFCFFDNIDRIAAPDYEPSEQDILLTRIKTTGIVEVHFVIKNVRFRFNIRFRVFDVGGQRSERKKWIHCFEDVNAVIYVTAISEYDEVLFEDCTTNRMLESMRLFESICNSRWFINSSIILFLNKKDLFIEKLKSKSIRIAFPQYDGPQTYEDSIAFIRERFEALNANPEKMIYVHQTCATDTRQVQIILDNVIVTVIEKNLKKVGMF